VLNQTVGEVPLFDFLEREGKMGIEQLFYKEKGGAK
jgi:hypothetical protein